MALETEYQSTNTAKLIWLRIDVWEKCFSNHTCIYKDCTFFIKEDHNSSYIFLNPSKSVTSNCI